MNLNTNLISTHSLLKIGIVANIFEWYEFCVYGYLAGIIGHVFFNTSNNVTAIIEAFSIFSMSYFMRPLGSLFFGYLGDQYGRSYSLKLSLLMMTWPTALIGMLPSYNNIGVASTGLLVILRLIQGFAAGGELPGSACYIFEAAPSHQRSLLCSAVAVSSLTGVLCGSLVASLLFLYFDHQTIVTWAWRIPFLFGVPLTLCINYIRRGIRESEIFHKKPFQSSSSIFTLSGPSLMKAILLVAFLQVGFYILFIWMPSYLIYFLNIPTKIAYLSNTLTLAAMALFCLLSGYLSRFLGRENLIVCSIIAMIVLTYPLFIELKHISFGILFSIQLLFALLMSGINGVIMETLGALFPRSLRCRGISLGFTLPSAFLGGTAPTLCSYLIRKTGILVFPAAYIILFGLITLPIAFHLKET